ncbi:MAG: hypothetical protein WBQ86_12335 [Candidatus Binatus sp.]
MTVVPVIAVSIAVPSIAVVSTFVPVTTSVVSILPHVTMLHYCGRPVLGAEAALVAGLVASHRRRREIPRLNTSGTLVV